MRFAIDLRFDLKRLDDTELAERFEGTWREFFAAKQMAGDRTLRASMRGFIRHPEAYPSLSFVSHGSCWWTFSFEPAIGLVLGSLLPLDGGSTRALLRMHLAQCEIADIADEITRRLNRRDRKKDAGLPTA